MHRRLLNSGGEPAFLPPQLLATVAAPVAGSSVEGRWAGTEAQGRV